MLGELVSSQNVSAALLEGVNRSTRPEHESRIDAVSRDLQSLRLLATQKQPANSDTINSATLTEADVKRFRARLASLTHSEDVLIADTIVSALHTELSNSLLQRL